MKLKVGLVVVAAFLVFAGSAQATRYQMRYGQALRESKTYAQELCEEVNECEAWGVGSCKRRSLSRYDCTIGTFFPPAEPAEPQIECLQLLHWGVTAGYIELKGKSRPRCF